MIKFEVGKTYQMRSACDHNAIWTATVLRNTGKSVLLQMADGTLNKKIHVIDDVEMVWPLGNYSMAPILRASNQV